MPSHHFSCYLLLFFTLFCTASLSSIPFLILLSLFWFHLPPYMAPFCKASSLSPYIFTSSSLFFSLRFPSMFTCILSIPSFLPPSFPPSLPTANPPTLPPHLNPPLWPYLLLPLGLFFSPQSICYEVTSQGLIFFKFGTKKNIIMVVILRRIIYFFVTVVEIFTNINF